MLSMCQFDKVYCQIIPKILPKLTSFQHILAPRTTGFEDLVIDKFSVKNRAMTAPSHGSQALLYNYKCKLVRVFVQTSLPTAQCA